MKLDKERFLTSKVSVTLLAVLCCLLWGSAFPCIKIGYKLFCIDSFDTMTQILFAGIRFFVAGVLIIIIGSVGHKKVLLPKKSSLGYIAILALFQTIIQYVFFYIGLANTSGVNGSIINGASSFFAIVIACCFRQEKLTWKKIIGCIIGFGGVILASLAQGQIGGFNILGEGFILISAVSYACSSVFIRRFGQKENPVALSGYQFMTGGAVMIIVGVIAGGRLTAVSVGAVFLLLYLAFLSAVAYTIWGLLLKYNPVSRISVFGFVIPIAGSLMSALFLKETQIADWRYLVALMLVCLGIFIVNFVYTKKKS